MSHRQEEKQARRAERLRHEQELERHQRLVRRAGYAGVGVIAAVLVTLAVVLGGSSGGSKDEGMASMAGHGQAGAADVGTKAPAFQLTDVVSKRTVSLASLAGRKTLLFFSEGVNCQACMVQVADLQQSKTLEQAGIRLVSVTTDPADQLAQAAKQYGITTPLLADSTTAMSAAYGMLGHGGMGHPTQDGHAFLLLDAKGRILWHQAYTEMYVKPAELIADMGPLAS